MNVTKHHQQYDVGRYVSALLLLLLNAVANTSTSGVELRSTTTTLRDRLTAQPPRPSS